MSVGTSHKYITPLCNNLISDAYPTFDIATYATDMNQKLVTWIDKETSHISYISDQTYHLVIIIFFASDIWENILNIQYCSKDWDLIRAGQLIACDCHAHLVSKACPVIGSKSPSPVSNGAAVNAQSCRSLTS